MRSLDLEKTINFGYRCVEVYPEEIFDEKNKPKIGEKLNKPATITFHRFDVKKGKDKGEIVKRLRTWAEKNGMKFVNYDFENKNLVVKVEHF